MEDQKLGSATGEVEDVRAEGRTAAVSTKKRLTTVEAENKKAKAPLSCLTGADAGCTAITTGEELEALYCRTDGGTTTGTLRISAIDSEEQKLTY
jgi:hypothetical protein